MVTDAEIQALADKIAAEFRPERIILFGSRATGAHRQDSDVDLLVVLPFTGSSLRKSVEILDRVDPPFAIDLLVRTPEDAGRVYAQRDPIVREAFDRGRTLYRSVA